VTDAMSVVLASPSAVKEHDKVRWLSLFTPDARIEDPVGAGAHVGLDRISAFWDVFIQPNDVTFHSRREFERDDLVVRYVTISTVTPVSSEPFALPAIVEYRVEDGRIASLRAFWEPERAVRWHLAKGLRGIFGLSAHGLRMTRGLGLGGSMGFGTALRPSAKRELGERIAKALGKRESWLELARGVELDVPGGTAEAAWDGTLSKLGPLTLEENIVAGDHVACVLTANDGALAVIARAERGELASLCVIRG
jgi:ketosteroid isomerase-like protein